MAKGVTVDFNANLARFTGAIDKATNDLNKFQSNTNRISGNINGMLAKIGVGLSIGAFGAFIKQSINAADELSKLAQKTGTSVEVLAGLKFAADQNGTSLEAVAKGAQKLGTQLVDKPELFKRMGITAKDSTGALVEMADIFASMPDGVEKTALAVKLMGKSGADMIPFLNQGSAALSDLIEEGQRYNPVTAESAKQAELFNDQLDALKAQASGLGTQIVMDTLPALTQITAAMAEAAKEGGLLKAALVGVGGVFTAIFSDDLLTREQKIVKDMDRLRGLMADNIKYGTAFGMISMGGQTKEEVNNINNRLLALQKELDAIQQAKVAEQARFENLKEFRQYMTAMRVDAGQAKIYEMALGGASDADIAKAQANLDKFKKIAADYVISSGAPKAGKAAKPKAEKSLLDAADKNELKNQQKRVEEHLNALVKAEEEANAKMQRSALEAQRIIADIDPIYKAGLAWEELAALVDQGLLTAEQAGQSYAKTFGESTDQMTTFAEQAGRNIQDAFSEFLFDPFKDGLGGMLDGFTTMLRKMAAEALASQILGSIGSWGKTGGGAGSFIGSIAASVFGGESFAGGGFTGSGSRTGGLDGLGGFPAILHPNETVVDHDKGQGRAVTVINNFTISQPTDRRTQEQIAAMAGASIQTAMMRGA